jgi:tRNA1(Val) A37 N6-methylase TrmN6
VKVEGIGHPIRIRPRTSDKYVFEQIFLEDDYDVEAVGQPHWIVDGGANVGYASVYFANRYPSASVLAIEPAEDNFRELQSNIAP